MKQQQIIITHVATQHSERTLAMDVYNGISVHLWEHLSSSLEGSHQEVNNRMVVSLSELRRAVALLEANGVEEGTRFTLVIEQL